MQFKTGTTTQITSFIPAPAQPLWNTEVNRMTVGDGYTPGGISVDGSSTIYTGTNYMTYLGVVANEEEMLSKGTVSIDSWLLRIDTNQAWVYIGGPSYELSSWVALTHTTADSLLASLAQEISDRQNADLILDSLIDGVSAGAVEIADGIDINNPRLESLMQGISSMNATMGDVDTSMEAMSASVVTAQTEIHEISAAASDPDLPYATTSVLGVVELATLAECADGFDTRNIVTPEGLNAAITAWMAGNRNTTDAVMDFNAGGYIYVTTNSGYYKVYNVSNASYSPVIASNTRHHLNNVSPGRYIISACDSGGNVIGNITGLYDFYNCTSFVSAPSALANFEIQGINTITHLPPLSGTSLGWFVIQNSSGITSIPALPNTVTTMSVEGCSSLTSIYNIPANVNTFYGSYTAIQTLPPIPPKMQSLYLQGCSNLSSLPTIPANSALTTVLVPNCNLPTAELDQLMTELGALSGHGTVNISYNPGTSSCNVAPATANGWTVYANY